MKKLTITISILIICTYTGYGQIVVNPAGLGQNFLSTNPNTRSLGIGNFITAPQSALHVNSILLPVGFQTGETFRTTGPGNLLNAWRMETGAIEKFHLTVPANSNNVFLSTLNSTAGSSGSLYLQTANGALTSQNRLKLNGLYGPGGQPQYPLNGYDNVNSFVNTTGYTMLGNNNVGGTDMNPWSLLHLNGGGAASFGYRPWMQTGITFTDNADMAYVGYRAIPNPLNPTNANRDRTEMVIAWSNDA